MKKGEILEGDVCRVDYPNRGIVKIGEEKIIVKNTLPGQKVRFVIQKKRSGHAEGRLLEVIAPSPVETRAPACSIYPACGGCMYLTMPYSEQLKMKEEQLVRLLSPFMGEGVWEGIIPSPGEFGYRNKMEFSFGDAEKNGPLTLGLHKRQSTYDILDAVDCALVHEDMTVILKKVLSYCRENHFTYYHKNSHIGYLRHLLLRRGTHTGELLICLVTSGQEDHDLQPLVKELLALDDLKGKIAGILHIINDSLADLVQSDETRILYGTDSFEEELLGLRFQIRPFSFFQPNSGAAEKLYQKVREYVGTIDKNSIIYDLYSGTGTITQLLSPAAKEVIGVEIVEEAVLAARENAKMNGLTNCRFLAGDVLKVLDSLTELPDTLILDPPRDGLHPKVLPKILSYGVKKTVYVSCKATSLIRDLPAFYAQGYVIERACAVDQFCQTPHVETIVLLQKLNS
ncbi:MAG: 23S rRNA (uracil(1939)-C(5))-methyltransferase RlmD [Blautia sp.]|nr:23S rRNA (uracil(1939)-C(5))-methyltransferase RlmD [Blautia sp.]